jgi:hypothetical protein
MSRIEPLRTKPEAHATWTAAENHEAFRLLLALLFGPRDDNDDSGED